MQELLPAEGCDLRVVVAGGAVVGAVARVASGRRVAHQRRLGSDAPGGIPVRRSPRSRCGRCARSVSISAGVDILLDAHSRPVVLEVNGCVDFNEAYGRDVFATAAGALVERYAAVSG